MVASVTWGQRGKALQLAIFSCFVVAEKAQVDAQRRGWKRLSSMVDLIVILLVVVVAVSVMKHGLG